MHTVDGPAGKDTDYFVDTLHQEEISVVNTDWYKAVDAEGVKVKFQFDTGAKCNIISHTVFKTLEGKKMTSVMGKLTSYPGHHIKTL